MIKISDLKEPFWAKLKTNESYADKYLGNEICDNNGKPLNVYIFKDEYNNFHMIIQIDEIDRGKLSSLEVEGLNYSINNYPIKAKRSMRFIDLVLKNDLFLHQFITLSIEICNQLSKSDDLRINLVNRVLTAWKYFWKDLPSELLTKEKQLGLLCELLFLERLINIDLPLALSVWFGPNDSKHDFVMQGGNVEVKSTLSMHRIHTINGMEQLDISDGTDLSILSWMATISNKEDSITLQSQIEKISNIIDYNLEELDTFYNKLQNAGYDRMHSKKYDNLRFSLLPPVFFKIETDFPCIKKSLLSEKIISRISSLEYRLSFENLEGILLDSVNVKKYLLPD